MWYTSFISSTQCDMQTVVTCANDLLYVFFCISCTLLHYCRCTTFIHVQILHRPCGIRVLSRCNPGRQVPSGYHPGAIHMQVYDLENGINDHVVRSNGSA